MAVQEKQDLSDGGQVDDGAHEVIKWKRPEPRSLKMNVDAGWTRANGQGYGLVVRDHEGECLFASVSFSPYRLSPLLAEAMGLRWALAEALRMEMDAVIVELDSTEVISCLVGRKCVANLEPIIQDCRDLAVKFISFSIIHTKREGNRVAHKLASDM
ncbi:uncharacterized protein LOC130715918 [Lotus japonicus]|uniref:uncharacterized protein LOC130715918 n=1 Tax=Lotus japonicus TaxID=34305 RepID=UPI0025893929|nr:uncharacterized protein LOC130715918 [Lotus japonicus]